MASDLKRVTVWRKAWNDTKHGVRTGKFWLGGIISVPVAGALPAIFAPHWSDAAKASWGAGISIATALLIALSVYLGSVIVAPIRLLKEADRKLIGFRQEENEQRKRDEQVNLLSQLFSQGGTLFARPVDSDEEYDSWKNDANAWLQQVIDLLNRFSMPDAVLFQHIEGRLAVSYQIAFNKDHNGKLGALKAHLDNLRKILEGIPHR